MAKRNKERKVKTATTGCETEREGRKEGGGGEREGGKNTGGPPSNYLSNPQTISSKALHVLHLEARSEP